MRGFTESLLLLYYLRSISATPASQLTHAVQSDIGPPPGPWLNPGADRRSTSSTLSTARICHTYYACSICRLRMPDIEQLGDEISVSSATGRRRVHHDKDSGAPTPWIKTEGSWRLRRFSLMDLRLSDFRWLSPAGQVCTGPPYPIHYVRYWWIAHVLAREAKRHDRQLHVLDAGAGRGVLARLTPHFDARWIAVDFEASVLAEAQRHYARVCTADLNAGWPFACKTVDVVVMCHVFEHLHWPQRALHEIWRVLKPGGLLVLAVPTLPRWLARLREAQFRRGARHGLRAPHHHQSVFWPARLRDLVRKSGFAPEFMSGSYLASGTVFDRFGPWVRFNLRWGAAFPAVGNELYLLPRKAE